MVFDDCALTVRRPFSVSRPKEVPLQSRIQVLQGPRDVCKGTFALVLSSAAIGSLYQMPYVKGPLVTQMPHGCNNEAVDSMIVVLCVSRHKHQRFCGGGQAI